MRKTAAVGPELPIWLADLGSKPPLTACRHWGPRWCRTLGRYPGPVGCWKV